MQKTTKTVWITSDKQEFNSETEAQAHEIENLITPKPEYVREEIGKLVVTNRDAILTILGARRKARSDKGTKRKTLKLPKEAA